jgi:hypothetical protein
MYTNFFDIKRREIVTILKHSSNIFFRKIIKGKKSWAKAVLKIMKQKKLNCNKEFGWNILDFLFFSLTENSLNSRLLFAQHYLFEKIFRGEQQF